MKQCYIKEFKSILTLILRKCGDLYVYIYDDAKRKVPIIIDQETAYNDYWSVDCILLENISDASIDKKYTITSFIKFLDEVQMLEGDYFPVYALYLTDDNSVAFGAADIFEFDLENNIVFIKGNKNKSKSLGF